MTEKLKDIVETKKRRKEEKTKKQTSDKTYLTATKNEKALKGAYRGFGIPKPYINS